MTHSSRFRANSDIVDASTFGDLESAIVHGAVVDHRRPYAIWQALWAPTPFRRKTMKLTIQSFALIVVATLSLHACAHGKHENNARDNGKAPAAKAVKSEFLGKGDGVKTCPGTGDEIQNKD